MVGGECAERKRQRKKVESFFSLPNTHPISFLVRWRKLTLTLQQTPSPAPACVDYFHIFFFSVLRTFLQYFPPLNIFSFLINIFCAEFSSFSQIPRRLSSISRGVKFPRDSNGRRLLSLQCGKKWKIKKLNIVFRWVGSRSHGDGYHCRPRRIVNYCEDFHSILITISRFL